MLKSLNAKTLWGGVLALSFITPAAYASTADAAVIVPQASQASTGTAIGTVTDTDGEPLIGATVRVEGTTLGTPTDINGEFSLANVKHGAKITVNYIGYKPQTMVWDGKALNFVLSTDANVFEEVVVMGYGLKQKRTKVTNSIAKVNEEILTVGANANPAQALAGAVSGVKVKVTTGDPGATPSIVVRGGTNWDGTGSPVVVVDGQIRESLSDINPNDIQSMEILKDAGATALYGARASNGVILITTKSGSEGTSRVTLNMKVGLNSYNTGYNWVGAEDYIRVSRIAYQNTSWMSDTNKNNNLWGTNAATAIGATQISSGMFWNILSKTDDNAYLLNKGWKEMTDPLTDANGNHRQILYRDTNPIDYNSNSPAVTQDYNVSFNGSNDKGSYYASLGYYDAEGALKETFYKRYNFSLSGSYDLAKWLTSNSTITFTRANWQNDGKAYNNSNGYGTKVPADYFYGRVACLPPTARWEDEDGNPLLGQGYNAFANLKFQPDAFERDYQRDKFSMTTALTAKIIDGLTLKGTMSWYYDEYLEEKFDHDYINNQAGTTTNVRHDTSNKFERRFNQTYNVVANYNRTFAEKHSVTAMLGMEYYETYVRGFNASGYGAPTGYFQDLALTTSEANARSIDSWHSKQSILSYFGRVEYDYMAKYLLAATFREDGYSSLIDNRWGFFPGVSAGWVFSSEDFWKDIPELALINFGKLRLSYGVNANASGIGAYTLQGGYGYNSYLTNYQGYLMSSLPNPGLKWERTNTFEVGLDLGLLSNRINLGLTYYNRLTSDKYAPLILPVTSGWTQIDTNNGKLRNQGLEIDVNATILRNRDFSWSIGANLTYNKNVVVALPDNGNENNRQGGAQVYSGGKDDKGNWNTTWIGGTQEGQEPMHLIGYKKDYIIRNESQIPQGYIDISNASRPIYADAEGYQRLKDMGYTSNATKLDAGDVVWKDRNGDNMIDTYDRYDLGNRLAHWTGGFNTTFRWKGLQLYARFDMGFDFTVYDGPLGWWLGCEQGNYSFPDQVFDCWTEDNPNAKYPRFAWASSLGTNNWNRTSDVLAQSGAYLACRELQLSYTLPQNICDRFWCKGLTISVTGQNLGYLKKCTNPLPDYVGLTNGTTAGSYGTYNLPRTVLFGLNVSF